MQNVPNTGRPWTLTRHPIKVARLIVGIDTHELIVDDSLNYGQAYDVIREQAPHVDDLTVRELLATQEWDEPVEWTLRRADIAPAGMSIRTGGDGPNVIVVDHGVSDDSAYAMILRAEPGLYPATVLRLLDEARPAMDSIDLTGMADDADEWLSTLADGVS